MNIVSNELGADSVIIKVAGHGADGYEAWYATLTDAIRRLGDSGEFDVPKPTIGDFVTAGVRCLFNGRDFAFWSDVPGEILIKFGTLRPRRALELIDALKNVWAGHVT
jgi:hypothetical protein